MQSDRSSKGQISVCYYGCCYASLSSTYYTAQCGPSTLILSISQPVYVACPQRVWLETLLRNCSIYSVRRPFPPSLELLQDCKLCSPTTLQSTRPSRSPMEIVGAISAIVALAHSGLQIRKRIAGRGQAGLLSSPLRTLRTLIIILYPCSQVASEKAELYSQNTKRYQPQGTRRRLRLRLRLRAHSPSMCAVSSLTIFPLEWQRCLGTA